MRVDNCPFWQLELHNSIAKQELHVQNIPSKNFWQDQQQQELLHCTVGLITLVLGSTPTNSTNNRHIICFANVCAKSIHVA